MSARLSFPGEEPKEMREDGGQTEDDRHNDLRYDDWSNRSAAAKCSRLALGENMTTLVIPLL